jgi:hypothetical protein
MLPPQSRTFGTKGLTHKPAFALLVCMTFLSSPDLAFPPFAFEAVVDTGSVGAISSLVCASGYMLW